MITSVCIERIERLWDSTREQKAGNVNLMNRAGGCHMVGFYTSGPLYFSPSFLNLLNVGVCLIGGWQGSLGATDAFMLFHIIGKLRFAKHMTFRVCASTISPQFLSE